MKRFKIGDKVIALTNPVGRVQPRVKGKIYIVKATKFCSECGDQCINIFDEYTAPVSKCICNHRMSSNNMWWTNSKLFAHVQDLESEIAEAVAEEDYEFADILHKIQEEQLIEK
jgi:hypothetical protein